MKTRTQGEIEAAVCEGVSRFEQDYMGRGPKAIHTRLMDDVIVVRLKGVLTSAEQHLARSHDGQRGDDLLKQVRTHLLATAKPILKSMVREITGVDVLAISHDISIDTDEEFIIFTLEGSPIMR